MHIKIIKIKNIIYDDLLFQGSCPVCSHTRRPPPPKTLSEGGMRGHLSFERRRDKPAVAPIAPTCRNPCY